MMLIADDFLKANICIASNKVFPKTLQVLIQGVQCEESCYKEQRGSNIRACFQVGIVLSPSTAD